MNSNNNLAKGERLKISFWFPYGKSFNYSQTKVDSKTVEELAETIKELKLKIQYGEKIKEDGLNSASLLAIYETIKSENSKIMEKED